MESFTQSINNLIILKSEKFKTPRTDKQSGIMLLKLIISESTIETKSTNNHLWGKLISGIPEIISTVSNNIIEFNTEI